MLISNGDHVVAGMHVFSYNSLIILQRQPLTAISIFLQFSFQVHSASQSGGTSETTRSQRFASGTRQGRPLAHGAATTWLSLSSPAAVSLATPKPSSLLFPGTMIGRQCALVAPSSSVSTSRWRSLHDRSWCALLITKDHRCCSLPSAIEDNSCVAELLLGDRPMPSGGIPSVFGPSDLELQAALYVHACGVLWRSTLGALDFLRRVYNTHLALVHLGDLADGILPAIDADLLEKALSNCDINAGVWWNGRRSTLLNLVLVLGPLPEVPSLVRLMLEKGARVDALDDYDQSPLLHASYNAAEAGAVIWIVTIAFDLNDPN